MHRGLPVRRVRLSRKGELLAGADGGRRDAAEEKGISIICDIVFNHLATDGGKDAKGLPTIDPETSLVL